MQKTAESQVIKDKVNNVYKMFFSTIISIAFAQAQGDLAKKEAKEKEQTEILSQIQTDEENDCFDRLLMAEFKEEMYECDNAAKFTHQDALVLWKFQDFVRDNYDPDFVYYHEHDPTHYMFDDDCHYYSFYEMKECYGENTLEEWVETAYNYDENITPAEQRDEV